MKFLNQTASGSTEPSEAIASTSTQQTSEIPLENAPDALNTESERQLDVELGSSSSQSKFDAETLVLSSSSQEEQIDIDSSIRSDDASATVQQVLVNSDPGLWTFPITDTQRRDIVRSGPTQQLNSGDEYYPKGDDNRHFSNFYFSRKLKIGETQHRRWLVYSNSQNKVYCFPCRLFSNSQTQVVQGGCCDWKHLSRHENNKEHMAHMFQWLNLEKGINQGKTIDQENERGHRESLKTGDGIKNSGNFIDLFKLISKFDPTLREHMKRISDKQLSHYYLSHDIQNELIILMSKTVAKDIIRKVKEAKYYSFLLDCTRDCSRVEQMSVILRFCDTSTGTIVKHFMGFLAVTQTTGEYLTNAILQHLEKYDLNIQDCRGQGYDNGANMREQILKHCNDLHNVLRVGESSDFQPFELYEELNTMIPNLPNFIKDVKQLLSYITENSLKEIYPNIYIVIRILLTIPVSTASAERSFSKLKLIKNK
ncbi:zinc finger MYM-type protein 1-like [Bactrocera oleae]|uniref:zinc finger MYM-type protein 1-like n=1 Tax=Bactrocera oleae TaxID=104688 RepID=UPI00387E735B